MATFSGTDRADTITPDLVSAGVVRTPAGAKPSAIADRIDGGSGNDILDGGGGRDTINGGDGHDTIALTAAGGTVHGDGGDDDITITPELVWSRVSAEPDSHAVGTSLSYAFPGARLSVTGEPGTTVIAANGVIEDPGPGAPTGPHNFATTGMVLFGQDPADAPGGGWGQGMPLWNADEFGQLRVDFDQPTDLVSIDFAFDDDDVASLKAFSASGVLLEEVTGSGRGPETFTGTIARDAADIGYITAGGIDREALYLDNLRYNAPVAIEDVSATVYGDAGNDKIKLDIWREDAQATGTLSFYGGDGNDTLVAQAMVANASGLKTYEYGGAGNDRLEATTVITGSVAYPIEGGNNDDYLFGGPGDDSYFVLEQKDVIVEKAGEGYDTVEVYWTDYTLPANVEKLIANDVADWNPVFRYNGNALDNVIIAANGDDTIFGGAGNDTIYGATCNDTIDGGPGADRLFGDEDDDRLFGQDGNDRMYGGTGADELGGQAGNDTMYGGAGNDKLGGGTGNDLLYGDADADVLAGREGLDQLRGGTGNDIFDYDAVTDSRPGAANRDVIFDFVGVGAAVGDRIDLLTIDANTSVGGNQAFVFRGTAAFTGAGQVRVLASGADTLIQANTGGSLAPEMEILVKDGTATPGQWVAGDFIL